MMQSATQCYHFLFFFIGASMTYVPCTHGTERHIVLKTQNNAFDLFLPDVDECSVHSNPCDENADCSNTEGSYSCRCKLGFSGDGTTCRGSYYFTIRKAVSLCSNVHVILEVRVFLLFSRKVSLTVDTRRTVCMSKALFHQPQRSGKAMSCATTKTVAISLPLYYA